jgi:hypothetical protein
MWEQKLNCGQSNFTEPRCLESRRTPFERIRCQRFDGGRHSLGLIGDGRCGQDGK